ncbi:MAG: TIGR02301 family protein [Devosia sp.]|uniref:TIGR02301 family protein n=1 Tax=Devosia sp. TaxID=1871048 RepID=UPI001ACAC399|nr:TIGR02301 family protein [Devosia sp.]MBN9310344.1 TIGR02301 family protein [Devosia sp.]MBN9315809.1 TIGR02301 family protein [Devosia sp.]
MRLRPLAFALLITCLAAGPVRAVDPPYQADMERLSEILGSLYFLGPLCRPELGTDWRAQMADLINLDEPDDDRRQRLTGAFNAGYEAYARLYRVCTTSADEAMTRLLVEAEKTARDIHARYAE